MLIFPAMIIMSQITTSSFVSKVLGYDITNVKALHLLDWAVFIHHISLTVFKVDVLLNASSDKVSFPG